MCRKHCLLRNSHQSSVRAVSEVRRRGSTACQIGRSRKRESRSSSVLPPSPTEAHDDRGANRERDLSTPAKLCVVPERESVPLRIVRGSLFTPRYRGQPRRELSTTDPFSAPCQLQADILPVLVEYWDRGRRRYQQTDKTLQEYHPPVLCADISPRNGRFRR